MVETFKQLRQMSREEIERKYDRVAQTTGGSLNFYRDELLRRDLEEDNAQMLRFTRQVRDMTIAITVLTVVVAVMTGVNIYMLF